MGVVVGEGVRPQTRWFHQPGIAGPPGLPQPRLYVPCPRWREGKFQEVVEAEYVLLEMNGLFTYTYSLTAGTAGCSAQPQNWTTITQMAGNTAPFSWDREVRPALLSSPRAGDFRSCAVCAGSRLDLFRLLLTEHQRPQGLLTAAWVSHGSWRLKFNIKVPADLVRLFATPWTAAYQAPQSMGFSRQEYWSGLPLPSPTLPRVLLMTDTMLYGRFL